MLRAARARCLAALALAPAAWAQPVPRALPPMPPVQPPGAPGSASTQKPRPVDQAVADVDALSTSLLVIDPGLAEETGFANLYAVPGRPDLLMRRNGAIIAVFPRSEYVGIRGRIFPQIPAGTTFYIGQLPESLTGASSVGGAPDEPPAAPRPTAALRAASNKVNESAPGAQPEPPPPLQALPPDPALVEQAHFDEPPTIWTNERYRQRRLAQILDEARR